MACDSGLLSWILVSAGIGLLVGNVAWGLMISPESGWLPTFVAFVSVPSALVLLYGRGWRVALTGAAFGGLLVTPIAMVLAREACPPLGLPLVCAAVAAMAIGGAVAFTVSPRLPWMPAPLPPGPSAPLPPSEARTGRWVARRWALADFSEAGPG